VSRRAWVLIFLWITPPLAVSLASILAGLPAVLDTGMCPAAPPDVAAYPCGIDDYLARMTVGPWALIGHVTVAGVWTVCLSSVLAVVALGRMTRRRYGVTVTNSTKSDRGD
jgi:hypothetical protein